MALSPAQKQRRYRDRLKSRAGASPAAVEAALLAEVARAERGELSDAARHALADKLTDLAMQLLNRSHALSKMARSLRPPGRPGVS